MRRIRIRKSDGRFMYYGHVNDKPAIRGAEYAMLPEGTPLPEPTMLEPRWDGSGWVEAPRVPSRRDQLRAKAQAGTLTDAEMKEAMKELL